jgi:hypothetical protein
MAPDVFWGMSFPEWQLTMIGYNSRLKRQNQHDMYVSWWAGFHSQADPKKNTIRKWCDSIEDDAKVEAKRNNELEESRALWQQQVK